MVEFLQLTEERRRLFIEQAAAETGMTVNAIEKDWWVTLVLKAVFSLPMSQHFIFKGGTSLSKGYGLIERFSEDIDIALAAEAFGEGYHYIDEPSKTYVKRLKKKGCAFTSNDIKQALIQRLAELGVEEGMVRIEAEEVKAELPDKDPQTLFVYYPSLFEHIPYINETVKIEFGVRSLKEPFEIRRIQSAVGSTVRAASYSEEPFNVPTAAPHKTLLEKMLLLHEKFESGDAANITVAERQSRHLADIVALSKAGLIEIAIADKALFTALVKHRSHYVTIKNVTYEGLALGKLKFIPPGEALDLYRRDYEDTVQEMIYGEAIDFDSLIKELTKLQEMLAEPEIS